MKLSAENVRSVVSGLFPDTVSPEDERILTGGGDVPGMVKAEGIRARFVFDQKKLEGRRADVAAMLSELPEQFRKDKGGGWSFLNACMTQDGEQWAEQATVDDLVALGRALGLVDFVLPREAWAVLPGGMPYIVVNP